MNDKFAPIPVGKVAPRPSHIPAPMPQPLPSGKEWLEGGLWLPMEVRRG